MGIEIETMLETETTQPSPETISKVPAVIGRTIFEALAEESQLVTQNPDGIPEGLNRSLTRRPGGQTVPDDR